jgi:hypothetical protein
MADDDIETEDMVILLSSEDSDDEALFIENSSCNDRKKGNT